VDRIERNDVRHGGPHGLERVDGLCVVRGARKEDDIAGCELYCCGSPSHWNEVEAVEGDAEDGDCLVELADLDHGCGVSMVSCNWS